MAPASASLGAVPSRSSSQRLVRSSDSSASRSLKPVEPKRYVTLARFFAENVAVQAPSLERTVIESADAVLGADAILLA